MRQEAFKNQTIIFELTAENGNRTHVGVLKFEAEEGTIQIPPHVMRCLWGPEVRLSFKTDNSTIVFRERTKDV